MAGQISSLALYTTVYPGVEPFLRDWYRSVRAQTDQNYRLWIGLDALEIGAVREAMGGDPQATWIEAAFGETPAQIRQRALAQIVETCDGVVLVDSDDVLHISRVAAARLALQESDLAGCALRLVDQRGRDLGLTFSLPPQTKPEDVLPRNNIFGLSNTAFRAELLSRCLPIPAAVKLVDWFLATRAWLFGSVLSFDRIIQMDYRQHGANMARVRPPFNSQQIVQDTELVRWHFQAVRAASRKNCMADRLAELEQVAADVETFYQGVVLQPTRLECYVHALNALEPALLWWSCVAHPSLAYMWVSREV